MKRSLILSIIFILAISSFVAQEKEEQEKNLVAFSVPRIFHLTLLNSEPIAKYSMLYKRKVKNVSFRLGVNHNNNRSPSHWTNERVEGDSIFKEYFFLETKNKYTHGSIGAEGSIQLEKSSFHFGADFIFGEHSNVGHLTILKTAKWYSTNDSTFKQKSYDSNHYDNKAIYRYAGIQPIIGFQFMVFKTFGAMLQYSPSLTIYNNIELDLAVDDNDQIIGYFNTRNNNIDFERNGLKLFLTYQF